MYVLEVQSTTRKFHLINFLIQKHYFGSFHLLTFALCASEAFWAETVSFVAVFCDGTSSIQASDVKTRHDSCCKWYFQLSEMIDWSKTWRKCFAKPIISHVAKLECERVIIRPWVLFKMSSFPSYLSCTCLWSITSRCSRLVAHAREWSIPHNSRIKKQEWCNMDDEYSSA